jgi:hypothetical protein
MPKIAIIVLITLLLVIESFSMSLPIIRKNVVDDHDYSETFSYQRSDALKNYLQQLDKFVAIAGRPRF